MASITERVPFPDVELVETDGEPLESAWHRDAMYLLLDASRYHLRFRHDYFVGGNMFIYYNGEEARQRKFRGPDFFFVSDVRYDPLRPYWVVWEEGGRYPDLIIELLSPTTAEVDLTTKKTLYEQTFRTSEYFCYDPETRKLDGWRLVGSCYEAIQPNEHGWLWSDRLNLWVGTWEGSFSGATAVWLRFYDREGQLVPLFNEAAEQRAEAEHQRAEAEKQRAEIEHQRAEAEHQRAEAEKQRAETENLRAEAERQLRETVEAELARLKARLADDQRQS